LREFLNSQKIRASIANHTGVPMNRSFCFFLFVSSIVIFSVSTNTVVAQETPEVRSEIIATNLNNPCGLAIQPGTNHLFVADSGSGRVVRILDGKPRDVITGFPVQGFGRQPEFKIGPLGLLFLDKDTLVVGGGGQSDNEELLSVFKVPTIDAAAITADSATQKLSLKPEGSVPAEGDFFGLAKSAKGVYVTCNGDDVKSWIARADIAPVGKLEKFRRYIPTRDVAGVNSMGGLTFNPEGMLVAAHMGKTGSNRDSILAFYDEKTMFLDKFETDLFDITALAYGKKKNRLYALDFSFANPERGGLFKLIQSSDRTRSVAVKITSLDKPTAMVFDSLGNLYVTVIGSEKKAAESDEPADEVEEVLDQVAGEPDEAPQYPGQLIKIYGIDKAGK